MNTSLSGLTLFLLFDCVDASEHKVFLINFMIENGLATDEMKQNIWFPLFSDENNVRLPCALKSPHVVLAFVCLWLHDPHLQPLLKVLECGYIIFHLPFSAF